MIGPNIYESSRDTNDAVGVYYWPAQWASIVLLVVVCSCLSSSVTLPAVGPAGCVDGRRAVGRARGQSGGRHCTAGQLCYGPLGRHLVCYLAYLLARFEDASLDPFDNTVHVCRQL